MASRTDQQRCLPLLVDNPVTVVPGNTLHCCRQLFFTLGTVKQVGVEFASADAVADDIAVVILHCALPHHADSKAPGWVAMSFRQHIRLD